MAPAAFNPVKVFLRTVYKRKRFLVLFNFGVLLTAVLGLSFIKPVYQSTSQLLFKVGKEHISDLTLPSTGAIRPTINFNSDAQSKLIIQVLTGRALVEQVVRAIGPTKIYPKLADGKPAGIRWLLGEGREPYTEAELLDVATTTVIDHITAEHVADSYLVNVAFIHPDPEITAKVLNTLLEQYTDRYIRMYKNPQLASFFNEELGVLKAKLAESQGKLADFKSRHGIAFSVVSEREQLLKEKVDLEHEVRNAEQEEIEKGSYISQLSGFFAKINPAEQARLLSLTQTLRDLRGKQNSFAAKFNSNHPELITLRDQIASITKQLEQFRHDKGGELLLNGDVEQFKELQLRLNQAQLQRETLRDRKNRSGRQLIEVDQKLAQLDKFQTEFETLEHKVKADQERYDLYLTKFEESRISNAMDDQKIASVTAIEDTHTMLKPAKPKAVLLGLAVFFGLFLSLGVAIAMDIFGNHIETKDDVEQLLGLPILGSISELPFRAIK